MEYYLFETGFEEHITKIGESSFQKFYCDDGYHILMSMVNDKCPSVSDLVIKKSDGSEIDVEQFSKEIENLQKVFETL